MWYVVKFGEIIFSGTEEECGAIVAEDLTGDLEIYPEEGRIHHAPIWNTED